ncbi:MAG: glycosyltransferase, partial [Bacteroidetes bacterium]|nr:glycosyltransferase [Bacteroidota bacterium]
TMDCDGQDPPELIPEMIRKWKEGHEIVYARRKYRKDRFLKKYSAILYYRILTRFSDIKIGGNISDFRLIDRVVLEELCGMREKARYLRGMVYWLGFDYVIIDYDRPNRTRGKTGFSLLKMVRLAMNGILNFSLLPLRIGLVLGVITVLLGFFFLIYIACDTLFFEKVYQLYKWLSVITFIFVGFLFVLIWILGEYIGKIYHESKGRPVYVIHKKEGFSEA